MTISCEVSKICHLYAFPTLDGVPTILIEDISLFDLHLGNCRIFRESEGRVGGLVNFPKLALYSDAFVSEFDDGSRLFHTKIVTKKDANSFKEHFIEIGVIRSGIRSGMRVAVRTCLIADKFYLNQLIEILHRAVAPDFDGVIYAYMIGLVPSGVPLAVLNQGHNVQDSLTKAIAEYLREPRQRVSWKIVAPRFVYQGEMAAPVCRMAVGDLNPEDPDLYICQNSGAMTSQLVIFLLSAARGEQQERVLHTISSESVAYAGIDITMKAVGRSMRQLHERDPDKYDDPEAVMRQCFVDSPTVSSSNFRNADIEKIRRRTKTNEGDLCFRRSGAAPYIIDRDVYGAAVDTEYDACLDETMSRHTEPAYADWYTELQESDTQIRAELAGGTLRSARDYLIEHGHSEFMVESCFGANGGPYVAEDHKARDARTMVESYRRDDALRSRKYTNVAVIGCRHMRSKIIPVHAAARWHFDQTVKFVLVPWTMRPETMELETDGEGFPEVCQCIYVATYERLHNAKNTEVLRAIAKGSARPVLPLDMEVKSGPRWNSPKMKLPTNPDLREAPSDGLSAFGPRGMSDIALLPLINLFLYRPAARERMPVRVELTMTHTSGFAIQVFELDGTRPIFPAPSEWDGIDTFSLDEGLGRPAPQLRHPLGHLIRMRTFPPTEKIALEADPMYMWKELFIPKLQWLSLGPNLAELKHAVCDLVVRETAEQGLARWQMRMVKLINGTSGDLGSWKKRVIHKIEMCGRKTQLRTVIDSTLAAPVNLAASPGKPFSIHRTEGAMFGEEGDASSPLALPTLDAPIVSVAIPRSPSPLLPDDEEEEEEEEVDEALDQRGNIRESDLLTGFHMFLDAQLEGTPKKGKRKKRALPTPTSPSRLTPPPRAPVTEVAQLSGARPKTPSPHSDDESDVFVTPYKRKRSPGPRDDTEPPLKRQKLGPVPHPVCLRRGSNGKFTEVKSSELPAMNLDSFF